jgi:hypothetical protein
LSYSQGDFLKLFNYKLDTLLEKEELDEIKKEFKISRVFIGIKLSIDWDTNIDGLYSWSAHFSPIDEYNKLSFDVTMKCKEDSNSVKEFLIQRKELLDIVKSTFLYDHIQDSLGRKIDIHFTDSKSFSRRAQEKFFNKCSEEMFKSLFEMADEYVFLTLTNERGYSRWLITSNRVILWHYDGENPIGSVTNERQLFDEEMKRVIELRDPKGFYNLIAKDTTSYPFLIYTYTGGMIE